MSAAAAPRRVERTRVRSAPAPARRRAPRARASGRAASTPTYLLVALIAAMLSTIVWIQVAAIRANISAGDVTSEARRIETDSLNLRAAVAGASQRGKLEQGATSLGMILPPAAAYRGIRIRSAGGSR